ncbi:MAG: nucleoside 2-deoxyribosyltransferase [Bacteroidetes bacterium]|nr:nucleoside 2-deoxyribosyltransferase [Bacteroidota bacterium]
METKVYLSGGMNNSNWQQSVIEEIGATGHVFYNPREHNLSHSREYTIWDLFYVKNCDVLFAYMQMGNPSGYGLTLEIGYASALGKPIILVDEKSDDDENFKRYFEIVRESSSIVFNNLSDGIKFLKNIRNGIITM